MNTSATNSIHYLDTTRTCVDQTENGKMLQRNANRLAANTTANWDKCTDVHVSVTMVVKNEKTAAVITRKNAISRVAKIDAVNPFEEHALVNQVARQHTVPTAAWIT